MGGMGGEPEEERGRNPGTLEMEAGPVGQRVAGARWEEGIEERARGLGAGDAG